MTARNSFVTTFNKTFLQPKNALHNTNNLEYSSIKQN